MATIPDRQESQRRFAALPSAERRIITRAVSKGVAADTPRLAALAIAVARRQQRFWRYAWILGPLVGLVQFAFVEPEAALGSTAASTLALVLMSWFWYRRARRSEAANRALAERGSGRRPAHTPGRRRDERSRADAGGAGAGGATAARPPRPRGRKRR